jgi:hypothetical protein
MYPAVIRQTAFPMWSRSQTRLCQSSCMLLLLQQYTCSVLNIILMLFVSDCTDVIVSLSNLDLAVPGAPPWSQTWLCRRRTLRQFLVVYVGIMPVVIMMCVASWTVELSCLEPPCQGCLSCKKSKYVMMKYSIRMTTNLFCCNKLKLGAAVFWYFCNVIN